MWKHYIISFALILLAASAMAQAGAGNKMGDADKHYKDSLRRAGYPYRFPILGSKMVEKGFSLQYPVGAMLNLMGGSQEVNITDLKVGFNEQEPVPLDFIKFGEVKANMQTATTRLDLWVLPFVDLYGIVGLVQAKTNVNIASPFQFSSEADFKGYTLGLGTTLAGGYHGIITITDINYTWTHLDNLDNTVKTLMITPRIGYNFQFKEHPGKSIAAWIGATGFFVNQGTSGSINLSDLGPSMDPGQAQKIIDETEQWYQALTKPQQVVVKRIAQAVLNKMNNIPDDITVNYSLKKEPVSHWSMVVGAQYQINKRWQVRAETGFLGGRKSLLLSGNYRWRW
ncbi:hypothetical protein [Chitinophaga arvensicola]|uniref:Uncharacterized protein n=1 Tax=Chitinophaga arvensicola TaxID=29529 RepID=A0A1I0RR98_9BACT|nr:hypothetical protein [Chitinophaga arvensicola]SEW43679.1 hypothetical protein SAMN04488122_3248 [Chitinophaga arvensicola]